MKRTSIQRAYQNIRPDEEARSRMLNNILLSSEIPPAGKDGRKMRKNMKPMVVAAIIALMVLLMGCALIALRLQDLKIGEIFAQGQILDSEGNVVKESKLAVSDVISLHGFYGSPTYLAHQEWYQFKEEYSSQHIITDEENVFVPPEAYEAYGVYNQELIDKVDEIAEKYDLKLLGAFAPFQKSEKEVFYEALGIESLLKSESTAVLEKESGYFYAGGNFKVEFHMTMNGEDDQWPYRMISSMYYSQMDYFDTVFFTISNSEDWNQWNYTTSTGAEVLLAQAKSGYGACIFCIQEEALIYVGIDGYYQNDNGETKFMTDRQLEQVADQFDYSLKVESVDMELAKAKLEKYNNSNFLQESSAEYTSYDDFISARIAELGDGASEQYFSFMDINNDGTDDLIVGTEEQIGVVWMMKYGQMNLVMEYGENYKKLKETWPDMDKKPITEYFDE